MDLVRQMPPMSWLATGDIAQSRLETASAARPRPDLPPVTAPERPDFVAPRPPDQSRFGLVRAGLMSPSTSIKEYSPERALKPWGVAMLPDSARQEELREARAALEAKADSRISEPAPAPASLPEAAPVTTIADLAPASPVTLRDDDPIEPIPTVSGTGDD
ncbi:hypothetical protein [Limimaricola soesokkakensis]|uniref:hypothetical protein n=1 Tax=Limimaricola soesokkakensis TaxID=1343159 RepID=UPI003513878F